MQVSGVMCDREGGGVGDYVCSLSSRLCEYGHDVEILTYSKEPSKHRDDPFIVNRIGSADLPVVRFLKWGRDASIWISRTAEAERFDIVHAHTTSMAFPMFYESRTPLIVTSHGTSRDPVHGPVGRLALMLIEKRYYREARRVIAVSQAIARELVRRGISENRIEIIPNGSDSRRFHIDQDDRAIFRRSLGIDDNDFVVLFLGALTKRKGLNVLMEAIRKILAGEQRRFFHFLIAGDGPLRTAVQRLAENFQSVHAFGFVGEARLATIYSAADLFVIPSLYEGLPTTMLDAMTLGLPIIASDISAHRETIGSDGGIFVTAGDSGPLADAILLARATRVSLAAMAQVARLRSKAYDWDQITPKILALYNSILASPGRD